MNLGYEFAILFLALTASPLLGFGIGSFRGGRRFIWKHGLVLGAYYLAVYAPYAIMTLVFHREVWGLQCVGCVVIISGPILGIWFAFFGRHIRCRIPPDHCQRCGYDLTGNVSGKCPECGEPCDAEANAT